MKYFIAHLLTGDVYQYHRLLTGELASRFHTVPLHERVDPHITIKNFEANDYEISEVEKVLERLTTGRFSLPLTVEGFGRFGHKTIFLDVQKSRAATLFARECITELNALPWMKPLAYEGEKLHSSIARYLSIKQSKKIWRLLHKRTAPHFKTHMDAVTILKKPNKRWEEYRTFTFGPAYDSVVSKAPYSAPSLIKTFPISV